MLALREKKRYNPDVNIVILCDNPMQLGKSL